MGFLMAFALLLALVVCTHGNRDAVRAPEVTDAVPAVTHYDRNLDGVADLELHQPPHCDDCDWALVDVDFDGRYERRVVWSFGIVKSEVDQAVPTNVGLALGFPRHRGWE